MNNRQDDFSNLPLELQFHLLSFLNKQDVGRLGRVNKEMYHLSRNAFTKFSFLPSEKVSYVAPKDCSTYPLNLKGIGLVTSLPNGRLIIANDDAVHIFSLDVKGQLVPNGIIVGDYIHVVALSDNYILTQNRRNNYQIKVWDIHDCMGPKCIKVINAANYLELISLTEQEFLTCNIENGFLSIIKCKVFQPENELIAKIAVDRKYRLCRFKLLSPNKIIFSYTTSSPCYTDFVIVDLAQDKPIANTIRLGYTTIQDYTILADEWIACAISQNKYISIINTNDVMKSKHISHQLSSPINYLKALPNGLLAGATLDGTIAIIDPSLPTGKELISTTELNVKCTPTLTHFVVTPSMNHIITLPAQTHNYIMKTQFYNRDKEPSEEVTIKLSNC